MYGRADGMPSFQLTVAVRAGMVVSTDNNFTNNQKWEEWDLDTRALDIISSRRLKPLSHPH